MGSLEKLGVIGMSDSAIWSVASHPKDRIVASCGNSIVIWMDPSLKEHDWYQEIKVENEYFIIDRIWVKAYEFGNFEHRRLIRKIIWSPCGKMIISASFDSSISIWEFVSKNIGWACICRILGPESEVKCIDWSPFNNFLAACCRDKAIWFFSLDFGLNRKLGTPIEYDCIGVVNAHTNDIKKIKWHPTVPMVLLSCSYDNNIIVWAPASQFLAEYEVKGLEWVKLYTLNGHFSTVWDFTFSPNGEFLLSCSDDSSIILWHSDQGNENKFKNLNPTNFALTDTFKIILQNTLNAKGLSKYIQIDQASSFVNSYNKELYSYPIYSIEWCKYLNCIIVSSADKSLHSFSITDLNKLKHICEKPNAHSGEINSISWLNDDKRGEFISAGDDGEIALWKFNFE
ncbi:WD40 domain-containing protein [Cryptosporidium ubiquitum]|uniref:Probable cytosolic iron-sulfur protein assembly protein CIAO1 homolog n=1 Tax=Cryptosporidium ubiquitum TaxID=857276 RepID=A0A1J4MKC5_9CRYT|nr:WD40 domain-containing protein [Cryptosporidium ubiquitum]OII74664.1 WD40 domain-containing protein [Cryptosporidium ubiquitum]